MSKIGAPRCLIEASGSITWSRFLTRKCGVRIHKSHVCEADLKYRSVLSLCPLVPVTVETKLPHVQHQDAKEKPQDSSQTDHGKRDR